MQETAERALWQEEGREKRDAVRGMFAQIAPRYDLLNSLLSLWGHHRWRKAAVAKLQLDKGESALDVCCGTGDFMVPLREAVGGSGTVVGADFCGPMLELAHRKLPKEALALGDACRLPFAADRFDAVSVGWGIRNVPNIDEAHSEIFRVLRPGGRFVSADMAIPRTRVAQWASCFVRQWVIPTLGSVFGQREAYTYLPKSTETFMSREELAESMSRSGFVEIGWSDFMMGNVCIHWGKKP
jgi:demethylmenaquinone methyltransferase/2-methoxy-6-polyprenyl-1,4-benzoquinol methylase